MSVSSKRRSRAGSGGSSVISAATSDRGTSTGRVASSVAGMGAGAGAGAGAGSSPPPRIDDQRYMQWKSNVPLLYDWLQHYNFEWPSLSFCWGQVLDGGETESSTTQRFFMSTRTDAGCGDDGVWTGWPNLIHVAEVTVPKPHMSSHRGMSTFSEGSRSTAIKVTKSIVHPGEVNRVRGTPSLPDVVFSLTDSRNVYVWDTKTQPARDVVDGAQPSTPTLTLEGHDEVAEYAISISDAGPSVVCGASDGHIATWDLRDFAASTLGNAPTRASNGSSKRRRTGPADGDRLMAQRVLKDGHTDTVEGVVWNPHKPQPTEFASVGDDHQLIVWDVRKPSGIAYQVPNVHEQDVHAVDWNPCNERLLLTGSADAAVQIIDTRKLGGRRSYVVKRLEAHTQPVMAVAWCPHDGRYFVSCSDDGAAIVWNSQLDETEFTYIQRPRPDVRGAASVGGASPSADGDVDMGAGAGAGDQATPPADAAPGPLFVPKLPRDTLASEVVFRHCGHRAPVADVAWNPYVRSDPRDWVLASISDDTVNPRLGGGTLHLWRVLDLAQDTLTQAEVARWQTAVDADRERRRREKEGGRDTPAAPASTASAAS